MDVKKFIQKAIEVHGNRYDYSLVGDHSVNDKIDIICSEHGIFNQRSSSHTYGSGCPRCVKSRKKGIFTLKEFVDECKKIHNDKYLYNESVYRGWNHPITVICPIHGSFSIMAGNHLRGRGCQNCSNVKRLTTDSFIEKSKKIHGNKYDYSLTNITNNIKPITIVCPIHGRFNQIPSNHLSGRGCKKCGIKVARNKTRKTVSERIKQFRLTHGEKYEYPNLIDYKHGNKIEIICSKYGKFFQRSTDHKRGNGCPRCHPYIISLSEDSVAQFISDLGHEVKRSDRSILSKKEIDIVVPRYKLAIEYCGLRWHSDLYKSKSYHLDKYEEILSFGFKPIFIFEDEWIYRTETVKNCIKYYLNEMPKGIFGRKCLANEISIKQANDFFEKYHLQGKPGKIDYAVGGFDDKGMLIGAMAFGKTRTHQFIELSRFCTDGRNHPGLAGKLFKYFINNKKPSMVITYADRRWATGNLYLQLGFKETNILPPDYYYVKDKERYHKSSFRKSRIEKKFGIDISNKTESEIMKELKYNKIWDCGKIRYQYISNNS
jgi:hypothetical protein